MNEDTQSDEQSNAPTATNDGDSAGALSRRSFLRTSAVAGAGALALGASNTAAAAKVEETCEESYGTIQVADKFRVMDNQWGMSDAHQCVWLNDDGSYGYDFDASNTGGGINYPEVYMGTRPWGSDTGVPEFPLRRGDVDELIMEVDIDSNISGGEWDLAEEWWLLDGEPNSDNPPHTHEIMLVLDWGGGHDHHGMEQRNAWTDQFGNQIDHWTHYADGGGTTAGFHIFRVSGGMTTGKVDMKEIVDYLTNNYGIREDLMISGFELGNEYWEGASGETTYNTFNVTVNGNTYTSGSGSTDPNTPTPDPTTPTPEPPSNAPGSDLDGDGLNEDLNGNGRLDSDDVVTFFEDKDEDSITNNVDKFDFNRNGRIDYDDITELFKQL